MKLRCNVNHGILVILTACVAIILPDCATGQWDIDNPYADVDWKQHQQVKVHLHTHTTQSDGSMSPAAAIDKYQQLGYGALAFTDHEKVTWPWVAYGRSAERTKMVAVQGSETGQHHMNSYFCNVLDVSSKTRTLAPVRQQNALSTTAKELFSTLARVRQQNGVAVMNHPGRYGWPTEKYAALYKEWDELVGMEIFNSSDRYPQDRKTWDRLLTVLMPQERPVWGFSNDDMHGPHNLGFNWNVLLLPELSLEAVRRAMKTGAFFFVYAPKGHKGTMPPTVSAIEVDSRKGTIQIRATNYGRIEWISSGEIVHRGKMIDLATTPRVNGYIRAVIYAADDGSLIGTQPMRIQPAVLKAKRDRASRTWTSKKGKKVKGKLIEGYGTFVVLKSSRGKMMKIRMDMLSDVDLEYIESQKE